MTKNEAIRMVISDQYQIDSEWGGGSDSDPLADAVEILTALGITAEEIEQARGEI